ncbi:MAG: hypothetical protein OEX07_17165, partial [Gammaproteobacteria bacterium]|nr:hypothetical protein [Gammaproteobacteria bacterium]
MRHLKFILLFSTLLFTSISFAKEISPNTKITETASAQDFDPSSSEPDNNPQKLNSWQHLETLVTLIDDMDNRLSELRKQSTLSEQSKNTEQQKQIKDEINQVSQDLQSLRTALEMLATGGADLTLFGKKAEEKFDWREQLESVFEPILVEL